MLLSEVRGTDVVRGRTTSRTRAVRTFQRGGVTFIVTVQSDRRFATAEGPAPLMLFATGMGITVALAAFVAIKRYRRHMTIQGAELTLARHLARTDALTGLANRLALSEWLDEATAGGYQTAVLLCDLDRFKIINDARGHEAGDELLIAVAERLVHVAPTGQVARFGGDKFVVVLSEADVPTTLETANAMLAALRRPFTLGSDAVVLGASIGMAHSETGSDATRSSMLRDADVAMYSAKRWVQTCSRGSPSTGPCRPNRSSGSSWLR